MAKWKFVEWLLLWLLETNIFYFEWHEGNTRKSKEKHNVTTDEAESVFHLGEVFPLGVQILDTLSSEEERLGIIGKATNGKILQIAFVLRKEKIRIISARPASKKERGDYEKDVRKIFKRI